MNPKILLLVLLCIIGIIILSGCIGEKESEHQPSLPVNQTQPEVKELSIDEIIEKTKTAIDGISTYEFDSTHTLTKAEKLEEETITGKVDRVNKKKHYVSSSVEIAAGEEITIKTDTYVIKNIAYIYAAGAAWFKSKTDWEDEDILNSNKKLLDNASFYESGVIEGTEAYILLLAADRSIFEEKFMAVGGLDFEEMRKNAEGISVKLWVAKDTFLPLKEYQTVNTELKGEPVKIEIETKFKNYNRSQDIQRPKEAESAEDVMVEEKIENPEQVTRTIEAIDNVTSYKLGIKKSINKIDGFETETNEVECDRVNKKLINTNRFSVEEEGISVTIYTIYNLNYYNYEGFWFKSDTEWVDDDFLEVIKNLLKKTKVEVTKEGDKWIFDVKTNKDVFGGDFAELAATANSPEFASDELDLNAKNVVVKIQVANDTFLPVNEFMSIESKYSSSKITINKELNFTEYNKPVTINLPSDAEDAEVIE